MRSSEGHLERALAARKVAIFGASATPGKWGYVVVERLLEQGFQGDVILVNPRGGTAFGLPLDDPEAAEGADLAVSVTPAPTTPGIIEQCGEVGIGSLIVAAAGFGELGNHDLDRRVIEAARRANVRVIGPNCLGLFVGESGLNLTTLPQLPEGHVSFITQSGGLALQVGRRLGQLGNGFDVLLSIGNAIDVSFEEALAVIGSRSTSHAVLLYLERLDEGEAMLNRIAALSASLPVVTVLGGRTTAGRGAAVTHTGSMLSSWDRVAGVMTDAGALVFDALPQAIAAAAGGVRSSRPPRPRVFGLVDGGGHSVLLADAISGAGYELPFPPAELAELLAESAPVVSNPLDLAGAADDDPGIFGRVLAPILASSAYDAVIIGGIFGGYTDLFGQRFSDAERAAAEVIGRLANDHEIPVVMQTAYASQPSPALQVCRDRGIACVEWPDEAVAVLRSRESRARLAAPPIDRGQVAPRGDRQLTEMSANVLESFRAANIHEAIGDAVDRCELPSQSDGSWVLRLDGVAHKARIGAISVGVSSSQLGPTYDELVALANELGISPIIRMAPVVDVTHELIVAFWRHPGEGSGWAIGSGGALTEQIADVAAGRLPESEHDVVRLLSTTRISGQLTRKEIGELSPFCLALTDVFAEKLPELAELECNPVALTTQGPCVLDILPTA